MLRSVLICAMALASIACTDSDRQADADAASVASAMPDAGTDVAAAERVAATGDGVPAGRFGCTRSVYDASAGSYEFQPRGFVEFDGTGGYAYLGFESPSEGRVAADGAIRRFSGGHLDGGEFVPIEDRPGQFTLTAPGIDERWSCKDAAAD